MYTRKHQETRRESMQNCSKKLGKEELKSVKIMSDNIDHCLETCKLISPLSAMWAEAINH